MSDQPNSSNNDSMIANVATTAASGAAGAGLGLISSPFKSKIFLLVLLTTLGSAGWIAYRAVNDTASESFVDNAAPWLLRAGISFIAAFIFAYLVKRVIKLALIVGGVLIAGAIVIHKLGLGLSASDVDNVKDHVRDAAAAVQQQADTWWSTIKTYLPSGGAAGAGLWRGARQKSDA
jgi:uncharacterized membrane protein (Fun14 family)